MKSVQYYKPLSKVVSKLLYSKEYISGNMGVLEDAFIKNYYEILQVCFGVSFEEKRFKQFITYTNGKPKDIDILRFIGLTVESEESYVIINYFFLKFISIFLTHAKKDRLDEIYNFMYNQGILPNYFNQIIEDYEKVMNKKKTN